MCQRYFVRSTSFFSTKINFWNSVKYKMWFFVKISITSANLQYFTWSRFTFTNSYFHDVMLWFLAWRLRVRKLPSIRIQMVPSVEAALATLPSVVVLESALCLGISIFGAQVRNYEFGTGPYACYPMKLSRFSEKNKVGQKYRNFIRRYLYKLGQTPLDQQNISKVKHYFWRF